jgi:hypothetical protein
MKNEILDTNYFSAVYDDLDDLNIEFEKIGFEPCNELTFNESTSSYSYSTLIDNIGNKLVIEREEYGDYGTFYRYRIHNIFMPIKKMTIQQIIDKMKGEIIYVEKDKSSKIIYKSCKGYEIWYQDDAKYYLTSLIDYIVDCPNNAGVSEYYAKLSRHVLMKLEPCNIIIKQVLVDFY